MIAADIPINESMIITVTFPLANKRIKENISVRIPVSTPENIQIIKTKS